MRLRAAPIRRRIGLGETLGDLLHAGWQQTVVRRVRVAPIRSAQRQLTRVP